ncbi:MAG: hypothetical protein FJY67_03670 [Calditrichaeota bacterium]|nr:hypothetical protein [Calditrichota bacterium]
MSRSLPFTCLTGRPSVIGRASVIGRPFVILNAVKHLVCLSLFGFTFQIDHSPSPRHPVAPRATPSADRL